VQAIERPGALGHQVFASLGEEAQHLEVGLGRSRGQPLVARSGQRGGEGVQPNKATYRDQRVELAVRVSQALVEWQDGWWMAAIQFSPSPKADGYRRARTKMTAPRQESLPPDLTFGGCFSAQLRNTIRAV
jgi:hypothetical protein